MVGVSKSRLRLPGALLLVVFSLVAASFVSHNTTHAALTDDSELHSSILEETSQLDSLTIEAPGGNVAPQSLAAAIMLDPGTAYNRKITPLSTEKGEVTIAAPTPQIVINGSITADDPDQNGRLQTGSLSNCSGTNTCPGPVNSDPRNYDQHTFKNNSSTTECVTVTLNASGCGGGSMASASYLTSYNPANLCANFLGVHNSTFGGTQSYSFNVPAGATFVVVVYEASPNTLCPNYTLTVESDDISACPPDATETGSITSDDSIQAGRLLTGSLSNCSGTNTCPGPVNSDPRHYDSYTYVNTSSTSECVTVELDASACGGTSMASASYLGSYNPASLCSNFLGANNSTFVGKQSYSFNVPAGATFVVVVYEATANTGCSSYTLKVKSCGNLVPLNVAAGDLLISEFRLRGPNGANDEYIEIYNASGEDHTVSALSGSGYGVAASDGVLRCTIPNGTVIPNRGHFLCTNSVGYSLGSYPAGNATTATGNATYTTNIPDNAGIALFNNNTGGASFSSANRLDAVGSTSETNALYKEGTGYPALTAFDINYAFYRDNCGKGGSIANPAACTSPGLPIDTNNNATNFIFVDAFGTSAGAGQRLGSPGPENLSGPKLSATGLTAALLDPCASAVSPPNRVRDFTSDPANNSLFGTMDIRRTFTNTSGAAITRLRFRILDITTFPAPSGIADLRSRSSSSVVVTVDRPPCGSGTSNITVDGTTLEEPPLQPNGGGFNSTLAAGTINLGTPLANGATIDLRFLLGIQQTGVFRYYVIVEALP